MSLPLLSALNTTVRIIALPLACAALFVLPAEEGAGEGKGKGKAKGKGPQMFKLMDTDGSETISLDEWMAFDRSEHRQDKGNEADREARKQQRKEQRKERWENLGEEEKAAIKAKRQERKAAIDTDGDGKISDQEREAFKQSRKQGKFEEIDTDSNGELTKEELKAHKASHGHKGKKGGDKGERRRRGGDGDA